MKKFGFTLMEVIVALGIIGVVAAITAPVLENLVPDKDKIAVLKAYKIITDINSEIMEDPSVWQTTSQEGNFGYIVSRNNQYVKYSDIIKPYLNIEPGSAIENSRGCEFNTTDGNNWSIVELDQHKAAIYIDFNDEKKGRCMYNRNNCEKPGIFSFLVYAEPSLKAMPGDPLTAAYLANSNKLNDKKADYKTAREDNKYYDHQ